MNNSLNLAKAIDIGRMHEATLLHMNELAQAQCEEASVHEVQREETCGNCGRFHQGLQETNAQRLEKHAIGARSKIIGRKCVDQNW